MSAHPTACGEKLIFSYRTLQSHQRFRAGAEQQIEYAEVRLKAMLVGKNLDVRLWFKMCIFRSGRIFWADLVAKIQNTLGRLWPKLWAVFRLG